MNAPHLCGRLGPWRHCNGVCRVFSSGRGRGAAVTSRGNGPGFDKTQVLTRDSAYNGRGGG